jgi:uncharacterized protein DUF4328/uncharacterized protein DUF2510
MQPTPDWWRPTRSLANWLTWLLAAQALAFILAPLVRDQAYQLVRYHKAFDALVDGHEHEANRIYTHANQGFNPVSLLSLVGSASLVLLIIWMWRSSHNAQALGRTGARLSPGWAIAAWFIPLASYVLLYLLYSDLWRSSGADTGPGDEWRARPGSPIVRTFWSIHVVGSLLAFGAFPLAIFGATGESATRVLLVSGAVLSATAALLNILVVREITSRQEALQARDPAPTERPLPRTFATPTTVDGPGWYADPGGRFDHRYWDGMAWTEHVSRGGVAETAPVTPADWYPDPTRRFHWRYWTGHEWTEHVSRDGELFIDPIDHTGSSAPAPDDPTGGPT